MFQDFKLNIGVVILGNFIKKLGKILFNFLVTLFFRPNSLKGRAFVFLLSFLNIFEAVVLKIPPK
jgi:hypothetical protein